MMRLTAGSSPSALALGAARRGSGGTRRARAAVRGTPRYLASASVTTTRVAEQADPCPRPCRLVTLQLVAPPRLYVQFRRKMAAVQSRSVQAGVQFDKKRRVSDGPRRCLQHDRHGLVPPHPEGPANLAGSSRQGIW